MNSASLTRFMGLADASLQALFPVNIVIGGVSYAASGVGGSALSDYLAGGGGTSPQGTRYFRISKALLPERPASGALLSWPAAPSGVTVYTITEVPDRPHETSWMLHCVPRLR
jgi:hypothetical protein